jgi:hypothetical protein
MNRRHVLLDPSLQDITNTTAASRNTNSRSTRNNDLITQLEKRAIASEMKEEKDELIRQLCSKGRQSAAEANLTSELLRQERGKQPASHTNRRVISKARVIGSRELHRLRKKKLTDIMKDKEKKRKRVETQLKTSSKKKRQALARELKELGGKVTLEMDISEDEVDVEVSPKRR